MSVNPPDDNVSFPASQSKQAPPWPEWFFGILNNRAKGTEQGRTRGFVVVVPGVASLQVVQASCFTQQYNTCLTARYRLSDGPMGGNLLYAFLSDLATLMGAADAGEPPQLLGDLLPVPLRDPASDPWVRLLSDPDIREFVTNTLASAGTERLDPEDVSQFFGALHSPQVLREGMRLVLFAEAEVVLPDPPGAYIGTEMSEQEWNAFMAMFGNLLPERMGIVTSVAQPPSVSLLDDGTEARHVTQLFGVDGEPVDGGEEVARYLPSALTSDQPTTDDHLGLGRYADGLARLILHPGTGPVTIGVHGEWGKGKSSFMRMVRRSLVLNAPANRPDALASPELDYELSPAQISLEQRGALEEKMERLATADVIPVEFNAWQHQDAEHIWAGLVHNVSEAIERELPARARMWTPILHAWRQRRGELVASLIVPVVAAAIVGVVVWWLSSPTPAESVPSWMDRLPGWLIPVAPTALALWFASSRVYKVLNPLSKRVLQYVQTPDYRQHLGFQQRIVEDLIFLRSRLEARRWRRPQRPAFDQVERDRASRWRRLWKPRRRVLPRRTAVAPRMVVFIDDLDRCDDDTIMEILQTVNLILGASKMFVLLAMDDEKIFDAIKHHYTVEGPAGDSFAEHYLRKIIQLSFRLPTAVEGRRFGLIENLFSERARGEYQQMREEASESAAAGAPEAASGPPRVEGDVLRFDRRSIKTPRVSIVREVEDTGEELRAFEDLDAFIDDNPRELKRLVNVHRLVKILLERPEARPTKAAQRKLVGWLVFCARWPELIGETLRMAASAAPEVDCVEQLALSQDPRGSAQGDLGEFADALGVEAPLRAEDLRPGSLLADAARIALMVEERSPPASPPTRRDPVAVTA